MRARPDCAWPSTGGRRYRRDSPPGGNDPDRHLPRADAAPHGAARRRRHQRHGSLRDRVDAILQARRAGSPARTLGPLAPIRAPGPRRRVLRDPRTEDPPHPHARRARTKHRDPRGSGRAESAPARARPSRGARAGRTARSDAQSEERLVAAPAGGGRGGRRARPGGISVNARAAVNPGRTRAKGRKAKRQTDTKAGQPFIVLTGLSGSGKSQAIRALEDLGYFCVDNLPTTLIPTLAKLSLRAGGDIEKVAIVVDVREGNFLSSF